MMDILDFATVLLKDRRIEFGVERLNYYVLSRILVILGVVLLCFGRMLTQLVCEAPFYSHDIQFIETQCYAHKTFFFVNRSSLLEFFFFKDNREYYEYFPFYCMVQGLIFYLPHAIWWGFLRCTANPIDLLKTAKKTHGEIGFDEEITKSCLRPLEILLTRGKTMMAVYLMTKLFYLGCSCFSFWLLKHFLGFTWDEYLMIPRSIFFMELKDELKVMSLFPAYTSCNFMNHHTLGGPNTDYTMCNMNMNWMYMLACVGMFYTFVCISVVNAVSLLSKTHWILCRSRRERELRFSLRSEAEAQPENVERFVREHVQIGGVFVLSILRSTAGNLSYNVICRNAFEEYAVNVLAAKKTEIAETTC